MWFVKVFRGGEDMERVRRAVVMEVESPPPELYTVEEPCRRVVEEVAVYVAERGKLEKERYKELYRRFRKQYHLPLRRFSTSVDASSASLRRAFHQYSQNLLCGLIQTSLLPPGSDTAILTGAAEVAVFR